MDKPTFEREERYIVVKRNHLTEDQEGDIHDLLASRGVDIIKCVVVESDWPEYEPVWRMIEARCCSKCDGTGFKDHAGFAMDPCEHTAAPDLYGAIESAIEAVERGDQS